MMLSAEYKLVNQIHLPSKLQASVANMLSFFKSIALFFVGLFQEAIITIINSKPLQLYVACAIFWYALENYILRTK
jgi:hypothetical protein